jgi:hypothetical protein
MKILYEKLCITFDINIDIYLYGFEFASYFLTTKFVSYALYRSSFVDRIPPHGENEIKNRHRLIVYHRTMKTKFKEIENKIHKMKLKIKFK